MRRVLTHSKSSLSGAFKPFERNFQHDFVLELHQALYWRRHEKCQRHRRPGLQPFLAHLCLLSHGKEVPTWCLKPQRHHRNAQRTTVAPSMIHGPSTERPLRRADPGRSNARDSFGVRARVQAHLLGSPRPSSRSALHSRHRGRQPRSAAALRAPLTGPPMYRLLCSRLKILLAKLAIREYIWYYNAMLYSRKAKRPECF